MPSSLPAARLPLSDWNSLQKNKYSRKAVEDILNAFKILIKKQRQILSLALEIDDEGTNALMSANIREQEKLIWMYSSFLSG